MTDAEETRRALQQRNLLESGHTPDSVVAFVSSDGAIPLVHSSEHRVELLPTPRSAQARSDYGEPAAIVACTAPHRLADGCTFCGWDGDHATATQRAPASGVRGACSCGWRGPWQHGSEGAWQANADADDHYNDAGE